MLLFSFSASAQQQFPTLEKGFQAEKLYQFSDVDSVNVFSGTLLLNIPIGPDYALDGPIADQKRANAAKIVNTLNHADYLARSAR